MSSFEKRVTFVFAAAVMFWACSPCVANTLPPCPADTQWTNPDTGNWNDSSNWSNGLPALGHGAAVDNGGTATIVGPLPVTTEYLWVGYDNSGYVYISSGQLNVNSAMTLGVFGTGSFVQGGSSVVSAGTMLFLGNEAGSQGMYTLNSGELRSVRAYVGYHGSGDFVQNGGRHVVSTELQVGFLSGSLGTYDMYGSAVLTAPTETIGGAGTAAFSQRNGSVNQTSSLTVGATGTYSLDDSSLLQTGTSVINGTFNQYGGSHQVTGDLAVNGVYEISNSSAHLSCASLHVGGTSSGHFTLFDADVTVAGTATVGGSYGQNTQMQLYGGTFHAATLEVLDNAYFGVQNCLLDVGVINQRGGAIDGLQVWGTYNYYAGSLTHLTICGTVNLYGNMSANGGIENFTTLTLPVGRTLFAGGNWPGGCGFMNYNVLNITGGTISGGLTNDYAGTVNATGQIACPLANHGQLNVTGLLVVGNAFTNDGTISLPTGKALRLCIWGSVNTGVIEMTGGSISDSIWYGDPSVVPGTVITNGPGGIIRGGGGISSTVDNAGGVIRSKAGQTLTITTLVTNSSGGELIVEDNSTLGINSAFDSYNAAITLGGAGALIRGGTIANYGTLHGQGRVSSDVANFGTIWAEGGQLTFSSAISSGSFTLLSRIEVGAGASLLALQGLSANNGEIVLSGGTFDNNTHAMSNAVSIVGSGTIRSGMITNQNNALISLGGGPTADVYADVYNSNLGQILVTSCTATFYGNVSNYGTIKNTGGVIRFLGTFVNSGAYSSDPADNYFSTLTITPTGYLLGGAGDRFFISGNFANSSTNRAAWNTAAAELHFQGGKVHTIDLTGSEKGSIRDGYADNFAWGDLVLASGQSLVLQNAGTGRAALYVGAMALADGTSQIASITGNGLNIYYDPHLAANAYLGRKTFTLTGGGVLAPVGPKGDADRDGVVGGSDYTAWLNHFGAGNAKWEQADFDCDGVVGGSDYAIWLNNFGTSDQAGGQTPAPEPATLALLALGGAAILRRRKT